METAITSPKASLQRTVAFACIIAISFFAFWNLLYALVIFSTDHESSSHIILVPFISIYLIYAERSRIFKVVTSSVVPGALFLAFAVVLYGFSARHYPQASEQFLPGAALAIVLIWVGVFILCYGAAAATRASFALAFLLLMVPLPPSLLDRSIYFLQQGSTEIAFLLFRMLGVPVLRNGFILALPGVTIQVAKECSGIHSSVALFITCLLAAHLFLRRTGNRILFALLAFPLAIVKNGIRIATLTLLSIYVNPEFLTGKLHHQGGFVFFLGALVFLIPILFLLQRSESGFSQNQTTFTVSGGGAA
jgi:exosortase